MATHSSVLALENPRDRGAWWAAIYRVTQSRTQLRRLSTQQQHYIKGAFANCDSSLQTIMSFLSQTHATRYTSVPPPSMNTILHHTRKQKVNIHELPPKFYSKLIFCTVLLHIYPFIYPSIHHYFILFQHTLQVLYVSSLHSENFIMQIINQNSIFGLGSFCQIKLTYNEIHKQ